MEQDLEAYNRRIGQWVGQTSSRLKQSIASLSSKGKGELVRSLFGKTKKDFGEIESIVYSFNRYGVFFHKGVGRGYTMSGGRVVRGYRPDSKILRNRRDESKTVILGKPANREPKEWFNPVLDREIPRLANLIGEAKAVLAAQAAVKLIK